MGDSNAELLPSLSLSHPLPLTCAKLNDVLEKPCFTDTNTKPLFLFQKHSCRKRCQQENSQSLSATFGKVIQRPDVESEADKSINPAHPPLLTDTNLTSKMHQGQRLKRPVGARCIQNHVTGPSGTCRHQ